MKCPECGAESSVLESRPRLDAIRRRRVCEQGHRFSTDEMVVQTTRDNIKKRAEEIAADTRHAMVVAMHHGVSMSTVYEMRRRATHPDGTKGDSR